MDISRRKFLMPWRKEPKTIDNAVATDADAQAPLPAGGRPLSFDDCKELYAKVRAWEYTGVGFDGRTITQYRGAAPLNQVSVNVILSRVDAQTMRRPFYGLSIVRDTAVCAHFNSGKGDDVDQARGQELAAMYRAVVASRTSSDDPGLGAKLRIKIGDTYF